MNKLIKLLIVLELISVISIYLFIFLIYVFEKDYYLIIIKVFYFDIVLMVKWNYFRFSCVFSIELLII